MTRGGRQNLKNSSSPDTLTGATEAYFVMLGRDGVLARESFLQPAHVLGQLIPSQPRENLRQIKRVAFALKYRGPLKRLCYKKEEAH